jgi:hypothetical protein
MGGAFTAFDLDLRFGQSGEGIVEELLLGAVNNTVEVKTDRRWQDTGNVFVETECWSIKKQEFVPSGIMVSESEYYAFLLPVGERKPLMVYYPTSLVKRVIAEKGIEAKQTWSENPSNGYLIKPEDVLDYARNV